MREQAARRVGLGVIADEDHRIERLVEALDHAVTLEAVADQPRARIEILGQQIALAAVRVVDDDFGGAAFERAADRGVGVFGHQLARAAVFGAAGAGLIVADDAADAFHVDGDVDAPCLAPARQRQPRRTRREHEGHEDNFSKHKMPLALPKKSSCSSCYLRVLRGLLLRHVERRADEHLLRQAAHDLDRLVDDRLRHAGDAVLAAQVHELRGFDRVRRDLLDSPLPSCVRGRPPSGSAVKSVSRTPGCAWACRPPGSTSSFRDRDRSCRCRRR